MKTLMLVFAAGAAVAAEAAPVSPALETLRPGAVRPAGWILDRARALKDGFTGHMDEVDEHFRLAWTTNCMRRGAHLNWIDSHKGSWSAEGGAYWFDGLVRLAYQLDDPELKAMAKRRLEPVLSNTGPKTVGFIWWYDRTKPEDVEDAFVRGSWRFWTVGMSERVLSAWWQATGDARVPQVLNNVFGFADMATRFGGKTAPFLSGQVEAAQIARTPEAASCADIACKGLAKNPFAQKPWDGLVDTLNIKRKHTNHYNLPTRHGVWASEALLSTLRAYQWTGDKKLLEAVLAWYAFFDEHCRQPYGVTMMDEEWGWAGAKRGTETCDVAAETYTRENLLAALGDGKWGDDVERAVFNAGPGCVSRDCWKHVYFQMPNRTGAKGESAAMSCPWDSHLRYGLSVWPLCCTAALNRILPNYIQHMWLKTADGGVAAALYGPSTFAADLACGKVAFEEKTDYPFADTVEIRVATAPSPSSFPLMLRIPGWCASPEVQVNGEKAKIVVEKGFAKLTRAWKSGDRIALRLPMAPRVETWRDMNEFGRSRTSICLGPLLFAHAIPEKDDNTPAGEVREPVLSAALASADISVVRSPLRRSWAWSVADAPVKLALKDANGKPLELVPYGCTKLRISAFPVR